MAKQMKLITLACLILTIACAVVYAIWQNAVIFALAITFGTTFYHFGIRLLVGAIVNGLLHNRVDYNRRWFKVSKAETKLYALLKVKKWKGKLPTYNADTFDGNKHTLNEIAMATCQAEIVHEIIILLSFLPIVAHVWLGALAVFIITSVLSATFDLCFVIIQRYNRPRLLKIINKQSITNKKSPSALA